MTRPVTVSTGQLVLDAAGGNNTKLDFVDAVPAGTDGIAPKVSLAVSGSLVSGTTYSGPVSLTATATDNVAVTAITYVLDGGGSLPYRRSDHRLRHRGPHAHRHGGRPCRQQRQRHDGLYHLAGHSSCPADQPARQLRRCLERPVAGYVTDDGAAYTAAAGFGWERATDGTAVSLLGNGRERFSANSPDRRYDTFVAMQQLASASSGTQTPGRWEHDLAVGTYNVTVAVGDPSGSPSTHRITAESGTARSVVVINNFVATSAKLFSTVTARVSVTDGRLTLDANGGGVNTKIDFVDAVPVAVTTPTVAGRTDCGRRFGGGHDRVAALVRAGF